MVGGLGKEGRAFKCAFISPLIMSHCFMGEWLRKGKQEEKAYLNILPCFPKGSSGRESRCHVSLTCRQQICNLQISLRGTCLCKQVPCPLQMVPPLTPLQRFKGPASLSAGHISISHLEDPLNLAGWEGGGNCWLSLLGAGLTPTSQLASIQGTLRKSGDPCPYLGFGIPT